MTVFFKPPFLGRLVKSEMLVSVLHLLAFRRPFSLEAAGPDLAEFAMVLLMFLGLLMEQMIWMGLFIEIMRSRVHVLLGLLMEMLIWLAMERGVLPREEGGRLAPAKGRWAAENLLRNIESFLGLLMELEYWMLLLFPGLFMETFRVLLIVPLFLGLLMEIVHWLLLLLLDLCMESASWTSERNLLDAQVNVG